MLVNKRILYKFTSFLNEFTNVFKSLFDEHFTLETLFSYLKYQYDFYFSGNYFDNTVILTYPKLLVFDLSRRNLNRKSYDVGITQLDFTSKYLIPLLLQWPSLDQPTVLSFQWTGFGHIAAYDRRDCKVCRLHPHNILIIKSLRIKGV